MSLWGQSENGIKQENIFLTGFWPGPFKKCMKLWKSKMKERKIRVSLYLISQNKDFRVPEVLL
jgi:hypothetical protein